MNQVYTLSSAFTFNATGRKVDAVASPATLHELHASKHSFRFDFLTLRRHYAVYKFQAMQDEAIQGLVAFRPTPGILECTNMEICDANKRGKPVYLGVGKSMVALCCKVSQEIGFDGFIYFDAKNRLIPYYLRLGARHVFGKRMVIEPLAAQKLIDYYF